jgi:hypothetical protein
LPAFGGKLVTMSVPERVLWAVETLAVDPTDRLLEVRPAASDMTSAPATPPRQFANHLLDPGEDLGDGHDLTGRFTYQKDRRARLAFAGASGDGRNLRTLDPESVGGETVKGTDDATRAVHIEPRRVLDELSLWSCGQRWLPKRFPQRATARVKARFPWKR